MKARLLLVPFFVIVTACSSNKTCLEETIRIVPQCEYLNGYCVYQHDELLTYCSKWISKDKE